MPPGCVRHHRTQGRLSWFHRSGGAAIVSSAIRRSRPRCTGPQGPERGCARPWACCPADSVGAVDRQAPGRAGGLPPDRRGPVARRLLHRRRRGAGVVGRGRRGAARPRPARSTATTCGRCSPGMAPGTGGLTPNGEAIRPHPRRVPGFDLTFKAPKSPSVLYAVSDDPRVQGAVIEAGEAAMRPTLGWLEREAIRVRRGTGNQRWLADLPPATRPPPRRRGCGRSRCGDGGGGVPAPHLAGRRPAAALARARRQPRRGRRRAVVGVRAPRAVPPRPGRRRGVPGRVPGRAHRAARGGVAARPPRPRDRRRPPGAAATGSRSGRTSVDAWLAATGTPDTPEGRQAAVLATRRHKPEVEDERFDAAWKAEARRRAGDRTPPRRSSPRSIPQPDRPRRRGGGGSPSGFDEPAATRTCTSGSSTPRSGSPTCSHAS